MHTSVRTAAALLALLTAGCGGTSSDSGAPSAAKPSAAELVQALLTATSSSDAIQAARKLAATSDCTAAQRVAHLSPTEPRARTRRLLLRNQYVALYRNPASDARARSHAIRCLAAYDDTPSARVVAQPLLVDEKPIVRAAALRALPTMARSAPSVARRLAARGVRLDNKGDPRAAGIADVLVAIGAPAIPALMPLVTDSEWAAGTLVEIGRPAVAPLKARFRSGGFRTKVATATALLRLRRAAPVAVRPLVPEIVSTMMARLGSQADQSEAMDVLAEAGRPAVDPLVTLARKSYFELSSAERTMQGSAALALALIGERNPQAVAPLLAGLRRRDYSLIADLHSFYIQLGLGERQLVAALEAHGSSGLVLDYVMSGNPRLDRAARDWARRNGYTVTGSYSGQGSWAALKLGGA